MGESLDHTWWLMPTRAPDRAAPQRDPAGEEAGVLATGARLAANDSNLAHTVKPHKNPGIRIGSHRGWPCPAVLTSGRGGEWRVPAPRGGGTEATFRGPRPRPLGPFFQWSWFVPLLAVRLVLS